MRTRPLRLFAATAALAVALPAAAASADSDTTVTFEVASSTSTNLSIALAGNSATLAVEGDAATGLLPVTTVTDTRSGLLASRAWNVQVSTGDHFWRTEDDTNTFAVLRNRAHVYLPATSTVTSLLGSLAVSTSEGPNGTNRLGPVGETATEGLAAHEYTLISGTSALNLTGQSQHRFTPRMSVDVPAGQAGGTYQGTVVQTVSAGL